MNKDSFIIQDVEPRTNVVEFVVLQAGKGKAKRSSIYVSSFAFSYLEGLIWDKYREYSVKKKAKISRPEWMRIIQGIQVAHDLLNTTNSGTELQSILKFSIINPRYSLDLLVDQVGDFLLFVEELLEWLLQQVDKESSITVIKNYI